MITDPEKLRKIYEERICIIPSCKRTFYVPKNKRQGRRPVGIRPRNARTCSTKCSKEYSHRKWKVPKSI